MRDLLMPRISLNEEEVTITGWRKGPGEDVAAGEALLEVETDKAAMEVESPYTGVLAAILRKEGDTVRAGDLIGYLAAAGEALERPAQAPPPRPEPPAVEHGQLGGLPRTAPRPAAAVPPVRTGEPLPRARRAIARALTQAAAIPQLAVARDVDATAAAASPHSLSDLFAAAVARAAFADRRFNAWLVRDELVQFDGVALAFALDGPRGVVAPVLREAERLSLGEIARQRAALVARARQGRLDQAELEEATITLSNLGPLGVDMVLPIITPPQVAVVGLGRLREWQGRSSVTVTLVADHRVVDGADGARFLARIQAELDRLARLGSDAEERG